jgi:hypothetical protein
LEAKLIVFICIKTNEVTLLLQFAVSSQPLAVCRRQILFGKSTGTCYYKMPMFIANRKLPNPTAN